MKNNDYWKKRFANDIWSKYNRQDKKNIDLANMYIDIFQELDKEISSTLIKINGGKPMLSDMHKYNRLNKLRANIVNIVNNYIDIIEREFIKESQSIIKENYKDIMLNLGNTDFALPNKELIENITKYPWSGANFSERLWKNTQLLEFNLNEILRKGLVQGMTIIEMTDLISLRMDAEYKVALRLVRTETMAYLNQSSIETYKNAGINKVQWWTALDERVSSECKALHGKTYDINNTPMIPKHPNCRCTLIPIVEVN